MTSHRPLPPSCIAKARVGFPDSPRVPPLITVKPFATMFALFVVMASGSFAQRSGGTGGTGSEGAGTGAPEIDVAMTGAAVALLLGCVFILTTVRRKKLTRS